jgi:hypothetical protein
MNVENYVQAGEKVYCSTKTSEGDPDIGSKGTLACTDHRLIFLERRSVVDLSLRSIDEMEFHERYISWPHVALALLFTILGVAFWTFAPDFLPIPDELALIGLFGGVIFAIASLVDVYRLWKPTLIVSTTLETRKFHGGQLEDFPHAIRGAAN